MLSFSKWSKAIESGELVQKTHSTTNERVVTDNVWMKIRELNTHFLNN
jgi:hypothetical protein